MKYINSVYYCGAWGEGLDKIPEKTLKSLDILYFSNADISGDSVKFNNDCDAEKVTALKEKAPHLKVVLSSVGMTDLPQNISAMEEGARRLAEAALKYGFDGVDVDWEFPTHETAPLHTSFMRYLREFLGDDKLVTLACPTTEWAFDIMELCECAGFCDYINMMSYDCYSERPITCDHSAPLPQSDAPYPCASLKENIELFISKGIPPKNIIGGCAFYSRVWHNVKGKDGYKAEVGVGADYGPKFRDLTPEYTEQNGFKFSRGENLAPRLYNGYDFITYDDEISIEAKCKLCHEYDIAGLMAWEYACDTADNKLINLMREKL